MIKDVKDEVQHYYADCLTSDLVIGRLVKLSRENLESKSLKGAVVWAHRLSTQEIMRLVSSTKISGVIVEQGGFAGHGPGYLNGRGIQMAITPLIHDVKIDSKDTWVIINGAQNRITFCKDKRVISDLSKRKATISSEIFSPRGKIKVYVDVKDENELERGLEDGARGVGVLKTDWMGWNDTTSPSIESHVELYSKCLKKIGKRRLNIRLYDIGGDKIPLWAHRVKSKIKSPIGLRGIRALSILRKAYSDQISAIGMIAREAKVGVVLPMVTNVEEIIIVKKLFSKIVGDGLNNVTWGAMVEVPEAALTIKKILKEVDFIRIGPGDLSQACLAMDRENITPRDYSRYGLSPGVLKLIKITVDECKRQKKEVNICIDVEPSKELIQKLVRLGINTFCVSSNVVKKLVP